ncbi:MAG TPA: hypothetical protein PK771_02500 [Spirochaetota bacterium]|nr:hypothetical protein [Spirochaetota bacterium]
MDKRIFQIDEKCFIIYTGKSSADNRSFLRIGNSSFLDTSKEVQKHIRHIVIPDATIIDIKKEKDNIKFMESGKISYICNKKNQDILFGSLRKAGVDTDNLYHKDLSKEIENVNRLENKKHFFTIFYENKNVKLVFNEEIFFDLFSYKKELSNYSEDRTRLINFIGLLDKLNNENENIDFSEDFLNTEEEITLDCNKSSMFITQDNQYFALNMGMFKIGKIDSDGNFNFTFNCSQRFYAGRYLSIVVLERDEKKIELSDILTECEVLESQVLYGYSMDYKNGSSNDKFSILKLYKHLIDGVNKK